MPLPTHPSVMRTKNLFNFTWIIFYYFITTIFIVCLTVWGIIAGRAECQASSTKRQLRRTSNMGTPLKNTCHHLTTSHHTILFLFHNFLILFFVFSHFLYTLFPVSFPLMLKHIISLKVPFFMPVITLVDLKMS